MSAFILENNSLHSFLISLEPNTMILMLSDRYINERSILFKFLDVLVLFAMIIVHEFDDLGTASETH